MSDLRTAAQQALAFTMRDFASLRDFEAAKAVLHDNLRTALTQQDEPTVTEDMKSAVRWAPSSAYWSQRLREFFGPDAREGIDALERRLAKAQQAEPVEPVAALIAQRDALLEALKQSLEEAIYPSKMLSDVYEKARAAIKAVEENT